MTFVCKTGSLKGDALEAARWIFSTRLFDALAALAIVAAIIKVFGL